MDNHTPDNAYKNTVKSSPDSAQSSLTAAECLAGAVLGRLLTWGFITKPTLKDDTMRVIHEEIANAIQQALPLVDMTELQRLSDADNSSNN